MAKKTAEPEVSGVINAGREETASKILYGAERQTYTQVDPRKLARIEEVQQQLIAEGVLNPDQKWDPLEFYLKGVSAGFDTKIHLTRVRTGESRSRVDEVAAKIGLTDKEMAQILTVTERTLHRKPATEPLDSNMSERLLLLEGLIQHGLDVFDGRKETFARWLRSPRPSFGNVSPISTLDTIAGFRFVDDELSRIEEGMIS